MTRWPAVPLGDLLTLNLDPRMLEPDCRYPIAGVYGFGRGIIRRPAILGQEISATQLFQIKSGQFIYSRLKSFEGAFAIVTEDADGYFVSNEFPTFNVNSGRVVPGFLRWWFKRPITWDLLASEVRGIGARRERLHPDQLLQSKIPLPSLDEQHHIVAQLDGVEQQVESRTRGANEMEAELGATLMAGFQKITTTAPRKRMGDIAPLVRREIEIDPEAFYPELGIRSFGKGTFHKPPVQGMNVGARTLYRIRTGDLLFNITFAWEGAVAVAKDHDNGRFASHRFLSLVPNSDYATAAFLRYYFLTPEGIAKLNSLSPGSAGRNRVLSLKKMLNMEVPLPSLDGQLWFDSLQDKAYNARARSAEVAAELTHLLPAMLNQVF